MSLSRLEPQKTRADRLAACGVFPCYMLEGRKPVEVIGATKHGDRVQLTFADGSTDDVLSMNPLTVFYKKGR